MRTYLQQVYSQTISEVFVSLSQFGQANEMSVEYGIATKEHKKWWIPKLWLYTANYITSPSPHKMDHKMLEEFHFKFLNFP